MSFAAHRFTNGGEAGPGRWIEARSVPQSFSACQAVTAIHRYGGSRRCRRSMAMHPTTRGLHRPGLVGGQRAADLGGALVDETPGATLMNDQALPPIAGHEAEILALVQQELPVFLPQSNLNLEQIQSTFACALHMHQPTIPAGAHGELISHLPSTATWCNGSRAAIPRCWCSAGGGSLDSTAGISAAGRCPWRRSSSAFCLVISFPSTTCLQSMIRADRRVDVLCCPPFHQWR